MKQGDKVGGRYEVHEKIGEGGMQIVHRATDLVFGNEVAIKAPIPGQKATRFAGSAILSARVNNHYVAKTLDYVEDGGSQYLVEEYVPGPTLADGLMSIVGFVDVHVGARLLSKLTKGIAASHAVGVAHRDLKPSNILVTGGFNLEEVKITDFGIATLVNELFDDEFTPGRDLTKSTSGTVKGALPYMAPEMMFRKKGDLVGMESDVWSLGALMFEVLTGVLPFGEGFMVPANISARKIEPWPAFMTSNDQFAPLATSLQQLILRCLSWDKAARPTAPEISAVCNDLCYYFDVRHEGIIESQPYTYGFIVGRSGKSFFHPQNVYGANRPAIGKKAFFCRSPGNPHPRAFPVVVGK